MKRILLNTSGKTAEIIRDHEDDMQVIMRCPNCGQETPYGKTRMISGYVGCDNTYKDGVCYWDDLMPRVLEGHQAPEGSELRRKYENGLLYDRNTCEDEGHCMARHVIEGSRDE